MPRRARASRLCALALLGTAALLGTCRQTGDRLSRQLHGASFTGIYHRKTVPRCSGTSALRFWPVIFADQDTEVQEVSVEEELKRYPSIPLSEYEDDGRRWFINKSFPGLRMISKEPLIFVVPDLLSEDECEQLKKKGSPYMQKSFGYSAETTRTSSDVRLPYAETPALQKRFCELLSVPDVKQMETVKLIRYQKGQKFASHFDTTGHNYNNWFQAEGIAAENRIITLFVYLNTVADGGGGETAFESVGVEVRPLQGMGVIHFPSLLPDSPTEDMISEHAEQLEVGSFVVLKLEKGGGIPGVVTEDDGKGNLVVDFDWDCPGRPSRRSIRAEDVVHLTHSRSFIDLRTTHTGNEVKKGEKWIITQWVWPSAEGLANGAPEHTKASVPAGEMMSSTVL